MSVNKSTFLTNVEGRRTVDGAIPGVLPPSEKPKNLVRRRHTKSRRGCFTCKVRKIKCGEEFPTCQNCIYRGSSCRYPEDVQAELQGGPTSMATVFVPSVPAIPRPVSSAPTVFSMQEMRFFHHFLTSVRHPLPLGNQSVWLHEIPQLGHQHDFLLHAILALGASEMNRLNPSTRIRFDILKHRGRAISGLNRALDDTEAWNVYGHPDAVLATCYTLIYQSSHIIDGMQDFEVLVKGCALITEKIRLAHITTALNVSHDWPRQRIEAGVLYLQQNFANQSLIKRGVQSLDDLQQATRLSSEHAFWRALYLTLNKFCDSALEGYLESILAYSAWYRIAGGLLDALRDPTNSTATVLVASFLANMMVLNVLVPLQVWPDHDSKIPTSSIEQMVQWIDAVELTADASARKLLDWPKSVLQMIPELPSSSPVVDLQAVPISSKVSVLQNLPERAHMLLGDILRLGSEVTSWFEQFVYTNYQPPHSSSAVSTTTRPLSP